MTEDLDSDLEGLAGDLDNLDLDDAAADAEGAADAEAPAADAEGAGEGIELDDDLAAMLGDSGGGEEAPAEEPAGGGEDVNLDDMLAETGGGEDVNLDDMLAEAGGGEAEAEAPGAPAAAPAAPAPAPAPPNLTVGLTQDQAVNLEFLLDIKLHVTFEVGRSKMLISDLLTLGQGSVIELHRLVGDELDLLVNGKLVAKGEVVVVNEKFGCKITDIIPPEDRVKHLGTV